MNGPGEVLSCQESVRAAAKGRVTSAVGPQIQGGDERNKASSLLRSGNTVDGLPPRKLWADEGCGASLLSLSLLAMSANRLLLDSWLF